MLMTTQHTRTPTLKVRGNRGQVVRTLYEERWKQSIPAP